MGSMDQMDRLSNLASMGRLTPYEPTLGEIERHIVKAKNVLGDAKRKENSLDGRFENANSAGHALLMAAVKMMRYKVSAEKGHRMVLYQIMDALVPAAGRAKATLSRAHSIRNKMEYDGVSSEVSPALVEDMIKAVEDVQEEVGHKLRAFKKMMDPFLEARRAQGPPLKQASPQGGEKWRAGLLA